MWIKVKDGLQFRHPVTRQFIPAEGIEVPDDDLFFARRLRDGDIVVSSPPNPAPVETASSVQTPAPAAPHEGSAKE